MKILIGYDGSDCSNAALDDLRTAGLPEEVEAVVMSVAEVWLPPPPEDETLSEYAKDLQTHPQPFKAYQTHAKAVTEAETLATTARRRVCEMFPGWNVKAEPNYGSPAWEIVSKAAEMKADLIIVGSHGRSAVGRLFLGSISQKVLTEARCSVRVARGRIEVEPAPSRIVIGYDGSAGANAAVNAVVSRKWSSLTEVRMVAVTDPIGSSVVERLSPLVDWATETNEGESDWLKKLAQKSLQTLQAADLTATFVIEAGNPKQVLIDEAERWHADSIFVGANRFGSSVERFLLGSVSAAVAARAHCSVEIVRSTRPNP
jgi:nucleotide-binding universal stress UspA family protein